MMAEEHKSDLWVWLEYYCPWSYIAAVRMARVAPEYAGRARLVLRAFPLEVYGGGPPNQKVLQQEWWLAALQEPAADFRQYRSPNWVTTTLPAFEAFWCAKQQDEATANALDLRIRQAFFAESADLGRRDLYPGLAREVGLEVGAFTRLFESDRPRAAVLEEGRLGKEQYGVSGTPTVMTGSGRRLEMPMSEPSMEDDRIVSIPPLTCYGSGCDETTRELFEAVLA